MTELIAAGVELMLVGMGIVFAFLGMLIVAIQGMSELLMRFFPEQPAVEIPVNRAIDSSTVAAISAAIHQYRAKLK